MIVTNTYTSTSFGKTKICKEMVDGKKFLQVISSDLEY